MSESDEELPQIKEHKGQGDEWTARLIIFIPFGILALVSATIVSLIVFGYIPLNVVIEGSIDAQNAFNSVVKPILFGTALLMGLTFIMALMKEYGSNPVRSVVGWVGRLATNLEYNPVAEEDESGESE